MVALVAAEPLSTLGSGGEDAAPSGTAKTEGAEGHYYGLRMDAARKVCRLAAMPGLSKADPAVQLIVIRRKVCNAPLFGSSGILPLPLEYRDECYSTEIVETSQVSAEEACPWVHVTGREGCHPAVQDRPVWSQLF